MNIIVVTKLNSKLCQLNDINEKLIACRPSKYDALFQKKLKLEKRIDELKLKSDKLLSLNFHNIEKSLKKQHNIKPCGVTSLATIKNTPTDISKLFKKII